MGREGATKRHGDAATKGSPLAILSTLPAHRCALTLPLCHCATPPLLGLALLLAAGCQQQVVGYRPALLGSLPEAQSRTPVTLDIGRPRPGAGDGLDDEGRFDPGRLRREHEDGRVTLIARRPYHLMIHIYYTLINNERDLFAEQVLSDITREEYAARGLDPREAFDTLQARQTDILRLFAAIPQGELTPGVLMRKVCDNVYRLEAVGSQARSLRWRSMDVTMERGQWRLRWFGS